MLKSKKRVYNIIQYVNVRMIHMTERISALHVTLGLAQAHPNYYTKDNCGFGHSEGL